MKECDEKRLLTQRVQICKILIYTYSVPNHFLSELVYFMMTRSTKPFSLYVRSLAFRASEFLFNDSIPAAFSSSIILILSGPLEIPTFNLKTKMAGQEFKTKLWEKYSAAGEKTAVG